MSRARTGAAAPNPTHHLVWRLLARARGAASWAGSFGASWCSATVLRRRIPHACASRRLRRASNRRCGQLYPPAARQDCSSGSIASRCRALLTRPQIGSGGRLLRRRSELWWWPRGAAYERHQTSAHEPRSSANVETSSPHRDTPFHDYSAHYFFHGGQVTDVFKRQLWYWLELLRPVWPSAPRCSAVGPHHA